MTYCVGLLLDPERRRQGHAKRLLTRLFAAVERVGLSALRLETDWLWPPAVRLYLDGGFAVANWKHALSLVRWLATQGWPLIRSERTWADRLRWMDAGMPEGLAHKIQLWEAYAQHHGLPVRTPRIPGLSYSSWEALS
ncbi:MAG: hypothetical protein C1943_04815 [Halochromatium sp.]|nr:hypothetical protein [Halochromatium sp.]